MLFTFVTGQAAYSALVGALVGVIPNYFFAARLFRGSTAPGPQRLVREMYLGEAIKIVFTAALFVSAILYLSVETLFVILGYGATIAGSWGSLLMIDLGEVTAQRKP